MIKKSEDLRSCKECKNFEPFKDDGGPYEGSCTYSMINDFVYTDRAIVCSVGRRK